MLGILVTPTRGGRSPSPTSLLSSRPRRRSRPLPPQFRIAMPSSARKRPATPPPTEGVASIGQRSFYGSSCPPTPSSSVEATPPPSIRRKMATTEPKTRPPPALHRSKRPPKSRRSIFGLNKGVGHAIKKPKATPKPAPERPLPVVKATPIMFKVAPGLSGSLSSSVNFVVKNGQYQFMRRRSPRKMDDRLAAAGHSRIVAALVGSPVVRRTPRLFSPSSTQDYLHPTSNTPPKAVPSPVKFDPEEAEVGHDVTSILESLAEDEDRAESNDYVEYIDEDELHQVAWDAVHQIEGLALEDGLSPLEEVGLQLEDDSSHEALLRTPQKTGIASPRNITPRRSGRKATTPRREREITPRKTNQPPSSYTTPIVKTSARTPITPNQQPPSSYTTPIKKTSTRTPITPIPMGSSKAPTTPLSLMSSRTPTTPVPKGSYKALISPRRSTRLTPSKDTPDKVFSIFSKTKAKCGLSPQKLAVMEKPKRSVHLIQDANQMVIDAGQKRIGSQTCPTCGFFYTPGQASEERVHDSHHRKYLGNVSFPGWKEERVVHQDPLKEWRVLYVKTKDPKRHWEKVQTVLEVVDEALGVSHGLRQEACSEALLCVQDKRVVGFLLAEPILDSDELATSYPKTDSRVVEPLAIDSKARSKICGVSRVWVHEDCQRQGIATQLMDCLRSQYHLPMVMSKEQLALSHTTEMGSTFATRYFGNPKFLVYRPAQPL